MSCEVDPKHAEIIAKEFGMDNSKVFVTPIFEPDSDEYKVDMGKAATFCTIDATRYLSVAARANHLVADGPDIQFAWHKLSIKMASPTATVWKRLKRLARYLQGRPRLVHT